MYNSLYILLEGNDDERFFRNIINPYLREKYDHIQIWQYAQKSSTNNKAFLNSIRSMGADYIYTADMDDNNCVTERKREITSKLDHLNEDKIQIVIKEIESWYLAGIDRNDSEQFGLKYLNDTSRISKEEFNTLIPNKFDSRIDFMQEILKKFSIEIAKRKNDSLRYFCSKFIDPIINNAVREQVASDLE